jgi:modulator of FtsH protease
MDFQSQIAMDAGRTFAADAPVDERLVFLRKTYMLVLLGLGVTAAGGYAGATILLPYLVGSFMRMIVVMAVWFGAFYLARAVRTKPGINYLAMFGFTFLSGVTLGPLLMVATIVAGGKPTIIL